MDVFSPWKSANTTSKDFFFRDLLINQSPASYSNFPFYFTSDEMMLLEMLSGLLKVQSQKIAQLMVKSIPFDTKSHLFFPHKNIC